MLRGAMTARSESTLVLAMLASLVSVAVCAAAAIAARLAIVWTLDHGPMMAVIMFSAPALLVCYLTTGSANGLGRKRDIGASQGDQAKAKAVAGG